MQEKADQEEKTKMMAQLMTSLDIENDTQKRHIQELEQFIGLLAAALTDGQGTLSGKSKSGKSLEMSMSRLESNANAGDDPLTDDDDKEESKLNETQLSDGEGDNDCTNLIKSNNSVINALKNRK